MAGSFSVTISSLSVLSSNGGSKRAEVSEIKWIIEAGLTQLVASHATSIALKDRAGNSAGTMTWTPNNSHDRLEI
jgi:hypothetical protein